MSSAVTKEEGPGSNPESARGGFSKRNLKLGIVFGVVVIVLVLVGFVGIKAGRERAAHPVSVTFLYYTNIGPQGLQADYRVARFRITNRSQHILFCQQGVADVEWTGNWTQETNGFLYIHNPPDIEPGKSITVSVLAPSKGTRWRNSFFLMPLGKTPPWKLMLGQFVGRLPLGKLRPRIQRWIDGWMYSDLQPRVVTSETLKL